MSNQLQNNLDTILQDKNTNLLPENLKAGVTCLGVEGTMNSGIDTSDATAQNSDIAEGKTAYANGKKITGTLPIQTSPVLSTGLVTDDRILDGRSPGASVSMKADYSKVSSAIGLTADKIAQGNTILGVEGTYEGGNINDYIAVPADMTTIKIENCIKKIPLIDTSTVTSMDNMFNGCTSLTEIPLIDTSKVNNMNSMFYGCTSLTTIPLLNTSAVASMADMFNGCTSLTTIPLLDISTANSIRNMFSRCKSLSNDSLNNILAMLTNATAYTATKTLKYIGLSETQATTCTTLSNWAACEAAGWTTGY